MCKNVNLVVFNKLGPYGVITLTHTLTLYVSDKKTHIKLTLWKKSSFFIIYVWKHSLFISVTIKHEISRLKVFIERWHNNNCVHIAAGSILTCLQAHSCFITWKMCLPCSKSVLEDSKHRRLRIASLESRPNCLGAHKPHFSIKKRPTYIYSKVKLQKLFS